MLKTNGILSLHLNTLVLTIFTRSRMSLDMDGILNFDCYSLGRTLYPYNFYINSINPCGTVRKYLSRHFKGKNDVKT